MNFENDLKAAVRTIPDYPKPGILFRDITTLLGDPRGLPRARSTSWCCPVPAARSTRSPASRRAASSSAARWRTSSARLRADPQEGQAARTTIGAGLQRSNTASTTIEIHADAIDRRRPRAPRRRPDRHRRHGGGARSSCIRQIGRRRGRRPASSSTCRTSAAPTSCARWTCRCGRWSRSRGIEAGALNHPYVVPAFAGRSLRPQQNQAQFQLAKTENSFRGSIDRARSTKSLSLRRSSVNENVSRSI